MSPKRVLIVGGVAGGASCAARLRRLDEQAEIVVFEKGPYPSFANCGLPYYVGDAISDEAKLLVATPDLFRTRFNIEVRTEQEVLGINREERKIEVKDLRRGSVYQEAYDALVLSPGAVPVRPALPGVDLAGVFTLRTIPDSRAIRAWIRRSPRKESSHCRRRVHRTRNGRESGAPRPEGHDRRDVRPSHASARPRNG